MSHPRDYSHYDEIMYTLDRIETNIEAEISTIRRVVCVLASTVIILTLVIAFK